MGAWFQSDATGVTLRLPPLPTPPETALLLVAAAIALVVALRLLEAWPGRSSAKQRLSRAAAGAPGWLATHYVKVVFGGVAIICLVALWLGLWRVPPVVNGLLDQLETSATAEETRRIVFALAAVLATITIFGTLIAQAIRVWVNERATRTAEANLTTGLINTAVEGLGAEKTVSRIGRPVTLLPRDLGSTAETVIEWQGKPLPDDGRRHEPGPWQSFEVTEPNLEVRIGAILTLERIARENPREHIRVMDILCAYIRENAPAGDAPDHGLGGRPECPENPSAKDLERHRKQIRKREAALRSWVNALPPPRTDVQVALEVLGRRPDERKAREEAAETRAGKTGYRFDLRNTNLRGSGLSHLDFRRANLIRARLEGANLREARLEGADLIRARLEGANLQKAQLEGVHLLVARLEGANAQEARLQGAHLFGSRLEGANLRGARLQEAHLLMARLEGADLREVDFRESDWDSVPPRAAPAQSADFRGAQRLTQAQLDRLIGNEHTLLPEGNAPDTGKPFYIWSCWETEPPNFDRIVATTADPFASDADRAALRAEFLCGPDNPRRKTGTPLALDAPYPEGHPLARRRT